LISAFERADPEPAEHIALPEGMANEGPHSVLTLSLTIGSPYANWVNQLLFAANMSSVNFHISSREQTAAVSGSSAIAW